MKRISIVILLLVCNGCGPRNYPNKADALVSSNPPTTGEWTEKLPASWSAEEDARVWAAYYDLVAQGKDIVHILIANLDRKEFSTCISSAVPYSPRSVGDMCRMAAEDIFDPIGMMYKCRDNAAGETLMGRSYFWEVFRTRRDGDKWWGQNQYKTENEIKEMIRDWYIERETSFGFENDAQKKWILETINKRFSQGTTDRFWQ